jgi:GMP synthase-like glutamine amidotransferase
VEALPLQILALEHGRESQLGLFGEWAASRGHEIEVLKAHQLDDWPDPGEHDAIACFGANSSLLKEEPWMAGEVRFLREAHESDVPVLGICFGCQAMAVALGGRVTRVNPTRLGWTSPEIHDDSLIPPGPWFRWHEDVVTVPPGASELARIEGDPLAFEIGRSIALQFHPEVEADLVGKWITSARRRGVGLPVEEPQLIAETNGAVDGVSVRANRLFDAIAVRWLTSASDTVRS